jgi:hypothetical protein
MVWEITNDAPHYALVIIRKLSVSKGWHQYGFVIFRPTMQELLNIELFFHWKFNKIKTEIFFREIETHFGILKSVQLIRFHEGDFVVFKPKV